MTKSQVQSMAYDLTLEYIKNHPDILSCNIDNIPETVDKIADISITFYKAISSNRKLDKIYL